MGKVQRNKASKSHDQGTNEKEPNQINCQKGKRF